MPESRGVTWSSDGTEELAEPWLVRRDHLKEILLRLIYDEVFSPDTVAYVSRKVNEALVWRADPPGAARRKREAELAKARGELENVKNAIRQGILTPTTKAMLAEAERRVGELESALKASATALGRRPE